MLPEPDTARTSPVKLTVSLQALNLGIAVPLSWVSNCAHRQDKVCEKGTKQMG